jgi:hypothetical protein
VSCTRFDMTPEPLPRAADAEHLTLILRRSGALCAGRVCDVAMESSLRKLRSHVFRLRLTYDGKAEDAPRSLIFKTGHLAQNADPSSNVGRHEVAFYSDVASRLAARVVPRCFEAVWDATEGWHLLLEDLTESHFIPTEWPLPPAREQCETIVEAQARLHAAWWDDPGLGLSVGRWRSAADMNATLQRFAQQFERFADRHGDVITSERRALYERLLASASHLNARYQSRNLTIIHGDAHVWNCFMPRGGTGNALLFDWETWRIDTASDDLAYMMAMHWYPERRRRMERLLLDHYHTTLVEHGVSGYTRDALDYDYRFSALWQITWPIWQEAAKIPARVWWNNLERALLAVDDLGCRDLLG